MASKTNIQEATGSDAQNAQIIGLTAIIANLPGVSDVKAHAVDAAIEGACHELEPKVRDTASEFAHGILQAARRNFKPGFSRHQGVTVRGAHRGG